MKIIWFLAVTAIIAVSLSGCVNAPEPVSDQDVPVTIGPTPELTPAPISTPTVAPVAAPVEPVDIPVAPIKAVIPAAPTQRPAKPSTPDPTPTAPIPTPETVPVVPTAVPFDAFTEWLKHPTFTCEPGRAPGWLNEDGIPTSCVAN